MIDSDRLTGLTEEEIDDLLSTHGRSEEVESDLNHAAKTITGFCSFTSGSGSELNYFLGIAKANGFVHGMEAGYWDKIKETSGTVFRTLSDAIKNITDFFTGDGQKQIDDAKDKSEGALSAINKIDPRTPVNENSRLLNHGRYFKAPSLENIDEEDIDDLKTASTAITNAIKELDNVKTVGDLYNTYIKIQKASLTAAQSITDKIRKKASEASTATGALQKIKVPADKDEKEVKEALKLESEETIKSAKRKTESLRKLASLRNRFLAPTMVIVGSVTDAQALQNKTFKG